MSFDNNGSSAAMRGLRWLIVAAALAFILAVVIFVRTPLGDYWLRRSTTQITVGARPMNLLILANNARNARADQPLTLGTAAGQADVVLVLHIDPMQRGIWAITIPRDALVAQPHWHNPIPKIKSLFFLGDQDSPPAGPQLTMRAVSALIGLPIDGYIAMNFSGFRDAVDYVGGLDVPVRQRLYDPANSHADFQPGVQHMNGTQVLAFVRVRQNEAGNSYRVNDYQRMDAEVSVLSLLRAKILNPKTVAAVLPRFVASMRPDVATNLSQDRLVRLGFATVGVPITEVPIDTVADSMVLSSADISGVNAEGRIEGAEYVVLDPSDICRRLRRFGAAKCNTGLPAARAPSDVTVVVYGHSDLAARLRHNGYTHVRVGGAATGEGRVLYPVGDPASGWAIARLIGSGDLTVEPGAGRAVIVRQ